MCREHCDWLPLFVHVLERLDSNLLSRLFIFTECGRGVGAMSGLEEGVRRYVGGQGRAAAGAKGVCGLRPGGGYHSRS